MEILRVELGSLAAAAAAPGAPLVPDLRGETLTVRPSKRQNHSNPKSF